MVIQRLEKEVSDPRVNTTPYSAVIVQNAFTY